MKIDIYKLKKLLIKVLKEKELTVNEAEIIANDYWEAEISGKRTHGIAKFLKELQYINERIGSPKIIKDGYSLVLVDGRREIGQLAADYCVELAIKRAKKYGVAIVGIKNIQRYGILTPWVQKIAENNFIGIISNSCEPAVAPFGGVSPVLGTNPIAVGIPTTNEPILLDMATSKTAMSELLLNFYYKQVLPADTFLDKYGNHTQDIKKVKSVEVFGGYKGYGLSLVLEIFSGSLIAAKMGRTIKSIYDIGYYFQVIDPSFFQKLSLFKKQNDLLIDELKKSKKKNGSLVLIPGEKYFDAKNKSLKKGSINISKVLYLALVNEVSIHKNK